MPKYYAKPMTRDKDGIHELSEIEIVASSDNEALENSRKLGLLLANCMAVATARQFGDGPFEWIF